MGIDTKFNQENLDNNSVRDIRVIKRNLRQKYRDIRTNMSKTQKEKYDRMIFEKMISFPKYQKADVLLCFVSTGIEVDTINIINNAFETGKKVAVPKCLDKNGSMEFFLINSLDELKCDSFGILEPDPNTCVMLENYKNSFCILPGFAFDALGFRIGFGKGYYDRFLQKYTGVKVGVCYNSCLSNTLPRGRFDIPADYLVTQKYILTIKK